MDGGRGKIVGQPAINWHAALDNIWAAPGDAVVVINNNGKVRVLENGRFYNRIVSLALSDKANSQRKSESGKDEKIGRVAKKELKKERIREANRQTKQKFKEHAELREATKEFIDSIDAESGSPLLARVVRQLSYFGLPVAPTRDEAIVIIEDKYSAYLPNGEARIPQRIIYKTAKDMGDKGGVTHFHATDSGWIELQEEAHNHPIGALYGILVHEGLHSLSSPSLRQAKLSVAFIEGVTELLSYEALNLLRTYTDYGYEAALASHVRNTVREDNRALKRDDIFLNAFFKGEIDTLANAYDEIMGEGAFASLMRESESLRSYIDDIEERLVNTKVKTFGLDDREAVKFLEGAAKNCDALAMDAEKERRGGACSSVAKLVLFESAAERLRQFAENVIVRARASEESSSGATSSTTTTQSTSSTTHTQTLPPSIAQAAPPPQRTRPSRKGKEKDEDSD